MTSATTGPIDRAFRAYIDDRDPCDLAVVFDALAPKLLLLANHISGQPGRAEDLVQATFLRAIELADRFDRSQSVLPWLTGVLSIEAKRARRLDARSPNPDRLTSPPATAAPHESAELAEVQAVVSRAIQELPDHYTEVLTLRAIHGLTPTEIAHALRLSPETVKTRLRRGIERLRAKLPVGFAALLGTLTMTGRSLTLVRETVMVAGGATTAAATTATVVAAGSGAAAAAAGTATSAKWIAGVAATAAIAAWAVSNASSDDVAPQLPDTIAEHRDEEPGAVRRQVVVSAQPAVTPDTRADDAPPDTPPVYASLEGRFRDERGAAAGVEVTLLRLHTDALAVQFAPLPAQLSTPDALLAGSTVTDSGGRFLIEGIRPGGVWILRVAPVDRPPFVTLITKRHIPSRRVDIGRQQLPAQYLGEAVVRDSALGAVAGARVRRDSAEFQPPDGLGVLGTMLAKSADGSLVPDGLIAMPGLGGWTVIELPPWFAVIRALIEPASTAADSRGKFTWRTSGRSSERVVIDAPGFAPLVTTLQLSSQGSSNGVVTLQRLTAVRIRVVDVRGTPIPNAEVAIGDAPDDLTAPVALRRVGRADPDGEVRCFARRDRHLVVAVCGAEVGDPRFVTRVAPNTRHTIRLPAQHELRLRVADRQGRGISGAQIRLLPGEPCDRDGPGTLVAHQLGCIAPFEHDSVEDPDEPGDFTIPNVPAGPWLAIVAAPGCVERATTLNVDGPTTQIVELPASEEFEVEVFNRGFVPQRGVPLIARPVQDPGSPHAFAALIGASDGDAVLQFPRHRFATLAVAVHAPGLGWRSRIADSGIESDRFVLDAQGAIAGFLGSASGEADSQAWLVIARRQVGSHEPLAAAPAVVAPRPDKRVQIDDLTPGDYRIEAHPSPLSMDIGSLLAILFPSVDERPHVTVTVTAGGTAEFKLDPVPVANEPEQVEAAETLVGQITLDGGAPPAGSALSIHSRAGDRHTLPIAVDGSFDAGPMPTNSRFEVTLRLPPANVANSDAIELWTGDIAVDELRSPIDIQIRTAPITGRVSASDGSRAGRAEIFLSGTTNTTPSGRTEISLAADNAGFFAFDRLPSGTYSLDINDPERGWLRRRGISVGPDSSTVAMSLRLHPLLRFSGRADEAALRVEVPRLSELELERVDPDGTALRRTVVFGTRGFDTRLLPGRYRVVLRPSRRTLSRNGVIIIQPPTASSRAIPLDDVEVGEVDIPNAVLTERR